MPGLSRPRPYRRATTAVEHDGIRFERPGHATVRTETAGGTVVYVDPWTEVLDGEPGDGDVVLLTHGGFDHYDPDGIRAVATPGATVAVCEAIDAGDLTDLDADVVGLPCDGEATVAGIGVRTVPAHNDPDGPHVDEDGEPFHAEGEVIGLLVTVDGTTVFVPSDTDVLPVHGSIRADVFLPPIGGHYTMDRHETAAFARSVAPEPVLPVHYDTFGVIETDAAAFAEELSADGIRVERF